MRTFRHSLKDILQKRQLIAANGEPLYSYKLHHDEFNDLKATLMASSRRNTINSLIAVSGKSDWAGAFLLYATEWWRKEFAGGHWSWAPLFDSLGINESGLTPNQRNTLISSGFRYWRRPLLTNGHGRMFLGSVAVEGGLPLNLINDSNSRLAQYFEQVIMDFGKFSISKPDAFVIARAHDNLIARSFRIDAVYTIIAKISEAIFQLTDRYSLDEQLDPLRHLSAVAPNWADLLPLKLESDVAAQLLGGALNQAVEVQRKLPSTISLTRSLKPILNKFHYLHDEIDESTTQPEHWKYQLSVSLRSRVSAEYLQQLFVTEDLPSRFSLFALGKKPLLLAKAFKPANNPNSYLLDVISTQLPEEWFDCEIQLMAKTDDGQQWCAPIVGGGQLDLSKPWAFVDQNGHWNFLDAGVLCSDDKAILLATAVQDKLYGPDSLRYDLFSSVDTPFVRNLYMLEQNGKYTVNDYVIELGKKNEGRYEYVWQGTELPYETRPSKCYLGKPNLVSLSEDAQRERISANNILWFDKKSDKWRSTEHLPFGTSEVGYFVNNKLKKRFSMANLPNDLSFEIISGKQVNRGQIKLTCKNLPLVALVEHKSATLHSSSQSQFNSTTIDLLSESDQPPAQIALELWWQDKPKSVTVILPFPRKGICIYDGDSKQIAHHSEILVNDINHYSLHGFGLSGGVSIDFSLRARDLPRSFAHSAYFNVELPNIDALTAGISFSNFRENIQALFALSSALDARVQISVLNNGVSQFECSVASYSSQLQPVRETGHILLKFTKQDDINLFAIPLNKPNQTPLELMQDTVVGKEDELYWKFPDDELEPSPWLIYSDDKSAGIRPLLWTKDFELMPPAQGVIESAASIGKRYDRITAFKAVALQLSKDFNMPEWKYIHALLACENVPLATFDFWRGAIQSPEFLLALLLKANKKELQTVWMLDKQFPMTWLSLRVKGSVVVVGEFYCYMIERLGDDCADVAQNRIENRLTEFTSLYPALTNLIELLLYKVNCADKKQHTSVQQYMATLSVLRNELEQRNAEDKWPTYFANTIFHSVITHTDKQLVSLCLIQDKEYENNVLNAPVLAALASSGAVDLKFSAEVIHAMREYHRFDPEYFESSFALTQQFIINLIKV